MALDALLTEAFTAFIRYHYKRELRNINQNSFSLICDYLKTLEDLTLNDLILKCKNLYTFQNSPKEKDSISVGYPKHNSCKLCSFHGTSFHDESEFSRKLQSRKRTEGMEQAHMIFETDSEVAENQFELNVMTKRLLKELHIHELLIKRVLILPIDEGVHHDQQWIQDVLHRNQLLNINDVMIDSLSRPFRIVDNVVILDMSYQQNWMVNPDSNLKQVNKATELCFDHGHKFFVQGTQQQEAEELFKRGDELRSLHELSHTCVITEFKESDFKKVEEATELAKEVSLNSI
ncbi:hypothetical protein RF11_14610 [Thelohanellus kitauei]|uniref:Uncharacterized protein n=1 Tax=Thelohanellus kitauei TaxID=669202 RepID=A0A0C2NBM3_THEKT|nr:hypothetical protein RF11_14610 [Thelohanellus kitauei]